MIEWLRENASNLVEPLLTFLGIVVAVRMVGPSTPASRS